MYDYNQYAHNSEYPIHNSRMAARRYPKEDGYNLLKDINRKILRGFVFRALDDRGMISSRQVTKEDLIFAHDKVGLGKTFTVTIYGDDLGGKYGGKVFFANEGDVKKCMNFLEDYIGPAKMGEFTRSISSLEPDPITKVGQMFYEKWKVSDEEWPLAEK